jgi:guanylate kinase
MQLNLLKEKQTRILMPSEQDGVMVILSSPSGAGKTTLVNLLSKLDKFDISISHTTRQPRANEKPNKDYYFVNEDEFNRLIKNQEFLEYAKVFNNFYGTTRTPVIDKLNRGKNVLFDIDWQGADQIKNKKLDYKLITFFILPPSKEILFERLSNRDMKDKLIAEERMKQFGRDVLHWINYDYVVINDNLEKLLF